MWVSLSGWLYKFIDLPNTVTHEITGEFAWSLGNNDKRLVHENITWLSYPWFPQYTFPSVLWHCSLGDRRGSSLWTTKPRKGADGHRCQHAWLVVAYAKSQSQGCSLGQRGDFRNFRKSVTMTLTLDRVKVISTYTTRVGLPACLIIWL